jgi:hypothetical protein
MPEKTIERITDALVPLGQMLAADGYELRVSAGGSPETVVIDVEPTSAACADCLASSEVIELMARKYLSDEGDAALRFEIRHPKDA